MSMILIFLTQIALTVIACLLIAGYIRPFLKRVLVDLCGTEERAQFWTAFSNIMLVVLPVIFGLGFYPLETGAEAVFFEVAGLPVTQHIPQLGQTIGEELLRIHRCYDRARTPLARLLDTDTLTPAQAQALCQRYNETDPLALWEHIRRRLDALVAPHPAPSRPSPR